MMKKKFNLFIILCLTAIFIFSINSVIAGKNQNTETTLVVNADFKGGQNLPEQTEIIGSVIKIFDSTKNSCANNIGTSWHHYNDIWESCVTINSCTIDDRFTCSMIINEGSYVVLGKYTGDKDYYSGANIKANGGHEKTVRLNFKKVNDCTGDDCNSAPDFKISEEDIYLSSNIIYTNENIEIFANINNIGDSYEGPVLIKFFDNSQNIRSYTLVNVSENSTYQISINNTFLDAGIHDISIKIDPDNLITESDKTNNMASIQINVTNNPITKKVIGSEGGVIEVTDVESPIYGTQVIIPNASLSGDIEITISEVNRSLPLPEGFERFGNAIELGPHGTTFNKPIYIELPIDNITLDDNKIIYIGYYNESSEEWEIIKPIGYNNQTNSIIFSTNHFSIYEELLTIFDASSVNINFDLTKDTMNFTNDVTTLQNINCFSISGICYGMAWFSKWYYDNKESRDLRYLYNTTVAAKLSCDIYQEYRSEEWDRLNNLAGAVQNADNILFDGKLTRQDVIERLRNEEPVILLLGGTINGNRCGSLFGCGHAVVVTGWNKTSSKTGFFSIYDVNDNNQKRIINYTTEGFLKLGHLTYSDHTWGSNTDIDLFIFAQRFTGINFENYYNNISAYPRNDLDKDKDYIPDRMDLCLNTTFGHEVNAKGCSLSQIKVEKSTPINNSINLSSNLLLLTWNGIETSQDINEKYCVEIFEDSEPNDIGFYNGCNNSDYLDSTQLIITLDEEKKYYWNVWATDMNNNWTTASDWWELTTKKTILIDSDNDGIYDINDSCPGSQPYEKVNSQGCTLEQIKINLISPEDEFTTNSTDLTLSWEAAEFPYEGLTGLCGTLRGLYCVNIQDENNVNIINTCIIGSMNNLTHYNISLDPNKNYKWRVRGYMRTSIWGHVCMFFDNWTLWSDWRYLNIE